MRPPPWVALMEPRLLATGRTDAQTRYKRSAPPRLGSAGLETKAPALPFRVETSYIAELLLAPPDEFVDRRRHQLGQVLHQHRSQRAHPGLPVGVDSLRRFGHNLVHAAQGGNLGCGDAHCLRSQLLVGSVA